MGEWAWLGSELLLSFLLSLSEVKRLSLVASSEEAVVQRSVLSVQSPCTSWLCMAVLSGRCVMIGRVQSVVYFELLLGGFGVSLGLWRSVEEAVVVEGQRRQTN